LHNGIIIIETINPKCSYTLNNFFYLDPSHIRPYSPDLLQFILEWYGFSDIKIIYSSPCPEEFRLKTFPEHNYMDYAVIGWKK
jgi:O-antigen chain-terminating methyltransferase